MSFFVQLDLAALPAELDAPIREGLLQMFYCSSDDGSCETWAPFSGTHAIRIAPISVARRSVRTGSKDLHECGSTSRMALLWLTRFSDRSCGVSS